MLQKQRGVPGVWAMNQSKIEDRTKINYGYIEYFRKAMENASPLEKERLFYDIKMHEARRDYYTRSLKSINHLVQIDEKPNLELTEPKWELYKISISFRPKGKFHEILTELIIQLSTIDYSLSY